MLRVHINLPNMNQVEFRFQSSSRDLHFVSSETVNKVSPIEAEDILSLR